MSARSFLGAFAAGFLGAGLGIAAVGTALTVHERRQLGRLS